MLVAGAGGSNIELTFKECECGCPSIWCLPQGQAERLPVSSLRAFPGVMACLARSFLLKAFKGTGTGFGSLGQHLGQVIDKKPGKIYVGVGLFEASAYAQELRRAMCKQSETQTQQRPVKTLSFHLLLAFRLCARKK